MKKGKIVSCVVVAAFMLFAASFAVLAADSKAPETVVIKAGLWPTPTKSPVTFEHQKHSQEYKIACTTCHHKYENKVNVWKEGDAVAKCETCHTEATIQGEKKLPPDQQKLNLKLAFHENCQGCHQKLKKDKPDSKAPTTCTGCHPAQK